MSCKYCDKPHTKKSSLDRHEILCEFLFKTRREKKIEEEERNDLPPYHTLVKIVGELALKNEKLEQKIQRLEEILPKKKKRVEPIQWLTSDENKPQTCFSELHTLIKVSPDHIEHLMDKKFKMIHLVLKILEQLHKIPQPTLSIACFTEKNNTIYVYDENPENKAWALLEKENLVKFLNQVDRKIWKEFRQWQQDNLQKINSNEQLSIKRDEMQTKIASMDYKDEAVISKVKSHLYTLLKCDYVRSDMKCDYEM